MKFTTGAGGVAAAMLFLLLGTFDATPSRARQMDVPASPAQAMPATPVEAPATVVPAAIPLSRTVPQPAVETVAPTDEPAIDKAEEDCLATAIYFEAKGEPRRGQVAVAQVVVNRTRSGRFPSSVCGVVRQKGQFSFVHHGRLPAVSRSSAAWREADGIARKVLDGSAERVAEHALFFHARGVSAGWHAVRVAQIGNQIFYR
ncbi:MAG TPA: cell wall hydrolase [Allosphingosinicella sp.]|nr:cell wall hydrolase [Allosphingosinicella sp.]